MRGFLILCLLYATAAKKNVADKLGKFLFETNFIKKPPSSNVTVCSGFEG